MQCILFHIYSTWLRIQGIIKFTHDENSQLNCSLLAIGQPGEELSQLAPTPCSRSFRIWPAEAQSGALAQISTSLLWSLCECVCTHACVCWCWSGSTVFTFTWTPKSYVKKAGGVGWAFSINSYSFPPQLLTVSLRYRQKRFYLPYWT